MSRFLRAFFILSLAMLPCAAHAAANTIVSVNSKLCLDVTGASAGGAFVQNTCDNQSTQSWTLKDMGSNQYEIVNAATGLCVDDPDWASANGTPLQEWTCNGGTNQLWTLHSGTAGVYSLVNVNSKTCLDENDWQTKAGLRMQLWTCNGGTNQQWKFAAPAAASTATVTPSPALATSSSASVSPNPASAGQTITISGSFNPGVTTSGTVYFWLFQGNATSGAYVAMTSVNANFTAGQSTKVSATLTLPSSLAAASYNVTAGINSGTTGLYFNGNFATVTVVTSSTTSTPAPAPTPAPTPTPTPVVANGVCGSANGSALAGAPTTNLCAVGAASSVSGSGPWSWSCSGTNGGIASLCTVAFVPVSVSTPPTTTSSSPSASGGIKWHPGLGMYSSVFTALGNSQNGDYGNASAAKAAEIAALRAAPSKIGYWHGVYFWRALENTEGVIDGSVNGSNLDADYATVTGYQGGNGPAGTAVYNAPRRMVMMILHTDYFNGVGGSPTRALLPDWVANNPAYGPVGPDGVHYGYFPTTGASSHGDAFGAGTVIALWRQPVLSAYENFLGLLAKHVLPDGYTVDTSPYIEGVQLQLEMNDEPSLPNGATYTAADPSYTESGYISNLEALGSSAVSSFPHTSVMIPNNFSASGTAVQTLSTYMAGHRVGWAAADTFAYKPFPSSGGTGNYTFGQALYQGYEPPNGNAYSAPWTSGGPVYRGADAYFGIVALFDMDSGSNAQLFQMGQAIGYTHYAWAYQTGQSDTATNWLGTASSQEQWNTAPGTWGGILDALYNSNLTNTACPSSYAAYGGCITGDSVPTSSGSTSPISTPTLASSSGASVSPNPATAGQTITVSGSFNPGATTSGTVYFWLFQGNATSGAYVAMTSVNANFTAGQSTKVSATLTLPSSLAAASYNVTAGVNSGTTGLYFNGNFATVNVTAAASTPAPAPTPAPTPTPSANGVCGSANGTGLSAKPTTNLCSSGTASAVSGSGPWSWSCAGTNGGIASICTAAYVPVSTSTPPPTTSTSSGGIKWHPGHYLQTSTITTSGDPEAPTKSQEIAVVRSSPPQVLGYEAFYGWRVFENSAAGAYDFSVLDSDYAAVTGYQSGSTTGAVYNAPRRFMIHILISDFFFGSAPQTRSLPDYIADDCADYGPGPTGGEPCGYWTSNGASVASAEVAAYWRPAVANRIYAFVTALASHVLPDGYTVDTSPYVEAVSPFEETIDGPGPNTDTTWSATAATNFFVSLDKVGMTAFSHTNFLNQHNYFPDPTGANGGILSFQLEPTLPGTRTAMSGPDIFGYSSGLLTYGQDAYIGLQPGPNNNGGYNPWISGGTDLRGIVPYIASVEGDDMAGGVGVYTPSDIFKTINTTLRGSHIRWSYCTPATCGSSAPTYSMWYGSFANNPSAWSATGDTAVGVLTTIVGNPVTNTACPSSYAAYGGCNTGDTVTGSASPPSMTTSPPTTTSTPTPTPTSTAANGVCGSANGSALTSIPTSNLCSSGTASAVSGSGPWSWSCSGTNGGIASICTAAYVPVSASTSPPTTSASSGTGIKWHPGLWREDGTNVYGYPGSQVTYSMNVNDVASDSNYVIGLILGVSLGHITQSYGQYNFSYLDSVYNTLAASGKRLAIRMMWSQIGYYNPGGFNTAAFPAYMNDANSANIYGGMLQLDFGTNFGGYVLDVERQSVMDAFINAVQAICAHFDDGNHPYFEGLGFEETAWNVPSANGGAGWDENAFITQYLRLIPAARQACPHSLLTYRANWGASNLMESVAMAEQAYASGDGTTDFLTTYPNNMDPVMNGSVGGTNYLANSLQAANVVPQTPYSESSYFGPTDTATQFMSFALQQQVNYFFVARSTLASDVDGWLDFTWAEMKAAYLAAGGTFNTVCPTSYAAYGGCDTGNAVTGSTSTPPTTTATPAPTPTPTPTPAPAPTAANGVCGASNGSTLSIAPSANLCAVGTASSVSGSGPWSWSCAGSNGGTTALCTAQLQQSTPVSTPPSTAPANGVCGSANGSALTSIPTTKLCAAGTASSVTGSGPWSWMCSGTNGGIMAICTAAFVPVSISTPSSPSTPVIPTSGGVKWHPGMGMFSSILTTLGNNDNNLNPAASEKANEIAMLRASPSAATTWTGSYFWRALNNTQGVIDGSAAGSGLDIDYAQVTGYVSGNGPAGTAVYNAPRRMAIWTVTEDYWSNNPVSRLLPDWVANNCTDYGPVGPDGTHCGYFTTVGGGGSGAAALVAMWRPTVASAYLSFLTALANHVLPDGYTVDTSPYIEFLMIDGELSDEPQTASSAVDGAADPTFTSETAFYSQVGTMASTAIGSFPHTTLMINNNYADDGPDAVNLASYMASNAISFGSGDTFGLTSGTNIAQCGLCGETFAQMLYRGLLPPSGNPYASQWITGGTVYKGVVPMIGLGSNTELILSYGTYYTPQDIFNQSQFVGFTHLEYAYTQGLSGKDAAGNNMATANWLGNAGSMSQWNTAPGTWGGVLDTIYNNKLTNTACPSAYAARSGCNTQ